MQNQIKLELLHQHFCEISALTLHITKKYSSNIYEANVANANRTQLVKVIFNFNLHIYTSPVILSISFMALQLW